MPKKTPPPKRGRGQVMLTFFTGDMSKSVPIEADTLGPLAIHQVGDGESGIQWQLSHAPTGFKIAVLRSKDAVWQMAETLLRYCELGLYQGTVDAVRKNVPEKWQAWIKECQKQNKIVSLPWSRHDRGGRE